MEFEDWVPTGGPRLVRYAYLITGDRYLAEDLVQDVLVDAFSKWERISNAADVDSYLRRSVMNRRVSWWRRTGRREVSAVARHLPPAETPTSARPELWAACLLLPERQRAAVVLRYYEEREFAEIAEILGLRESSVRGLVSRGVAALKTSLSEERNDPRE